MISIAHTIDPNRLAAFVPYANRRLEAAAKDVLEYGESMMKIYAPRGQTQRLQSAIQSTGIQSVTDAHYFGVITVDEAIAPYARFVDQGTGVDGPFKTSVTVLRPSRSGKGKGAMRFQKKGEPARYRTEVKFMHSPSILAGKNFSGRTYDAMLAFTALATKVLAYELSDYFADPSIN